ncbi:MAG: RNA polymerase sigma factor [Planctomycetaceae bacterium]|nr:RNA polymerase sigma factor [Planctomycetaceae bacterium]
MSRKADEASPSDVDLMSRLSSGDETAMNELVARFGPDLHRLVGRLTAWSPDSEDILQEVFLVIWKKAGNYRGHGSLEGWLRRIAVTRSQNHQRGRAAFRRLITRLTHESKATTDEIPESRNDDTDQLRDALTRLSRDDRMVLVLYYVEDWSGEEVSEVLNISTSTLHVRLHRARQRLHDILTEGQAS